MLPANLVEFIHGPVILSLGTRNAALRPAVGRPVGVFADAVADRISFFLPRVQAQPHLDNIADNGFVALAAGDGLTSQNFQFKGKVIDIRDSMPADAAVRDLYHDKLLAYMHRWPFQIPDELVTGYIVDPSVTITFRVAKIFNQTPGPGAGKPVDFSPGGA